MHIYVQFYHLNKQINHYKLDNLLVLCTNTKLIDWCKYDVNIKAELSLDL